MGGSAPALRVGELVREHVEEAPDHTRGDDGVAVRDGSDGSDELGRQDVLQDKAASAETERFLILCGYTAVILALGTVLLVRRDA